VKKPAPAQQILAEQGYIILAADVSYPLGSIIPLADCGPDYERIPGPMVVIGEATIDEWRAQAKQYLGKLACGSTRRSGYWPEHIIKERPFGVGFECRTQTSPERSTLL
jgi:hypothetical protein